MMTKIHQTKYNSKYNWLKNYLMCFNNKKYLVNHLNFNKLKNNSVIILVMPELFSGNVIDLRLSD
jgi:hypothetical protein